MVRSADRSVAGPPPTSTPTTEEIWREFARPLRAFLSRLTGSQTDAEDLLQEVFIRLHQQLPTLRDPSKLQGWVYRIARHAAIDHLRARRPTTPLLDEPAADATDPTGQRACDLTPSLRRFIAALPPAYRDPLTRHDLQGEPLANIATSLGLSLTATKSRVRRARNQLRAMLDACCRFEFDRRGKVIEATPRQPCNCRSR